MEVAHFANIIFTAFTGVVQFSLFDDTIANVTRLLLILVCFKPVARPERVAEFAACNYLLFFALYCSSYGLVGKRYIMEGSENNSYCAVQQQ